MTKISSITAGPRQSNFELLRIVSMFLVLVVHADFFSLGSPTMSDFQNEPLSSFIRTFFQAVSIICVNVFVLISGWFGIKPTYKGFFSFIFQCLFFIIILYGLSLISGLNQFSLKGLAENLMCKPRGYWFIVSYSALYIIAPVLNSYVKTARKCQFACLLTALFIFQTIWGWSGVARFIDFGYSTFAFIGLYLLASYVRLYGYKKLSDWGGVIYILSIISNCIVYYCCVRFGVLLNVFAYVNPIIIIGALGLLLWFSKVKINTNRFINWIGSSAFAVYLFHCNEVILVRIFKSIVIQIYNAYSGIECIFMIFGCLLLVFITAILLDQPRKWTWNFISNFIF